MYPIKTGLVNYRGQGMVKFAYFFFFFFLKMKKITKIKLMRNFPKLQHTNGNLTPKFELWSNKFRGHAQKFRGAKVWNWMS